MFVPPMLLQKIDKPFDDMDYISELKLDGIRGIYSSMQIPKLYSRHNNEISAKFPEIIELPNIPPGTILDGEIIVTNQHGKPDFEAVMRRFQSKRDKSPVQYCVFDIIYYNHKPVYSLPLVERKKLLEKVIQDNSIITKCRWTYGRCSDLFNLCKQQDLEGIVMKKADSTYQINKRSYDWLKVINYQYSDIVITGLCKNEFGVLVGIKEDNKVRHMGLMEFMKPQDRKILYKLYRQLITNEDKNFVYLEPVLKGRIKYRNLTKAGMFRIPSFEEWIV
jgi:DNA ligase 1